MKLTMEIKSLSSGVWEARKPGDEPTHYVALAGTDTHGRYARSILRDAVGKSVQRQIASKLAEGEDIMHKRMVITLDGEWITSAKTKMRSFFANSFDILDGMELEAARLRNDASEALALAEKLRKSGQMALAYEAVAKFVANYAGKPLDLDEWLAAQAQDDSEFGARDESEFDPEAVAAAHFAKEDGIPETPAVGSEPPSDFAEDDEFQAPDGPAASEEDAFSLAAGTDVLDDGEEAPAKKPAPAPQSKAFVSPDVSGSQNRDEQPAPRPVSKPSFAPKPSFGSRPSF